MRRVHYSVLLLLLMLSVSFAQVNTYGDNGAAFVNQTAQDMCKAANVQAVYKCNGNVVRVVSSIPGNGSTFYKPNGMIVHCPVVEPKDMGADCLQMLVPNYCPIQAECGQAPVPQVFPGQNDTAEQTGNDSYYVIPGKAASDNTSNLTNSTPAPSKPPALPKRVSEIKDNNLDMSAGSKSNVDSPMNYLVYVVLLLGVGAVGVLFMLFRNSITDEEQA